MMVSCIGKPHCEANFGATRFRYEVADLVGCEYGKTTEALCRYRLNVDVRSTLSGAREWRNNLLRVVGDAGTAAVVGSRFEFVYEKAGRRIVDGIEVVQ